MSIRSNMDICMAEVTSEGVCIKCSGSRTLGPEKNLSSSNMHYCMGDVSSKGDNEQK